MAWERYIIVVCFFFLICPAFGQDEAALPDSVPEVAQDSVLPVKTTMINVDHADLIWYDEEYMQNVQILTGHVVFRHDSSLMYCDSAYFHQLTNSLEAFSNVKMVQGDTLFVYGDYLFYNGVTRLAKLRNNVRMENNEVTLYTDSLNYDRNANIGYYFEEGRIVDAENELTSIYGQYSPATKLAIFNDSVTLHNPKFVLTSDTLHYQTDTKIATILGPSILESDSGMIYTSRGWYDTVLENSLLQDRSLIVTEGRTLTGDSIFYNRLTGFGEVFGNMYLVDSLRNVIMEGQYGFYNELTEYAFATDSARALEYSQGDTLYIHGDTLQMMTDSTFREIKAYYGVRIYRSDLQGVCDSLQFNTRDSILYMYTDPVLWNEAYQLYGDTILIYMNDSTIDFAHVKEFAMASEQVGHSYFNQLKGNDLKAYFDGKELRQIDIAGNAESLYFPLEKDSTVAMMNETRSAYIEIRMKNREMKEVLMFPAVEGTASPLFMLTRDQMQMKDFYWFDYLRPTDKDDVFRKVKRKETVAPRAPSRFRR